MDFFNKSSHSAMDHEMDFFGDGNLYSPSNSAGLEYPHDDWFKNLFDDPILNDKMITEAIPPKITTEHSYSIDSDIVDLKLEPFTNDIANDFLCHGALDLSQKSVVHPIPCPKQEIKLTAATNTEPTIHTLPLSKPPPSTIIITTPGCDTNTYIHRRPIQTIIHRPHIKIEPVDTLDQVISESGLDSILPLTPPQSSSSCSDSDGSLSPHRSEPYSPQYSPISRQASKPFVQPVFTNPIPTSGVLILTDEEKRTLILEGYPIPTRLPLTKNEEKNLKKIRRKIKNKISAQESRRKKKEYLELLEKQVESYTHENSDLKRKVDSLECSNKTLLGQLQKLQSLVGKYTGNNVSSTPAGSILMVVVLCFAMFLGNWEPSSLNIGYNVGSVGHEGISRPNPIHPAPYFGPSVKMVHVDAYSGPNMKSRMLLSLNEACLDDEGYGPRMPMLNPEICGNANAKSYQPDKYDAATTRDKSSRLNLTVWPIAARVLVNAEQDINDTEDTEPLYVTQELLALSLMHPDIATLPFHNITVA